MPKNKPPVAVIFLKYNLWLLDRYLKTTCTVFPPPRIFASWNCRRGLRSSCRQLAAGFLPGVCVGRRDLAPALLENSTTRPCTVKMILSADQPLYKDRTGCTALLEMYFVPTYQPLEEDRRGAVVHCKKYTTSQLHCEKNNTCLKHTKKYMCLCVFKGIGRLSA